MKKLIAFLALVFSLSGCGSSRVPDSPNIKLNFLDDFIISGDLEIEGTKVGGLSGIDLHEGTYYLISDDPSNPRFYTASVDIDGRSIDSVRIHEVVRLDRSSDFLKQKHLDLESIRYDASGNQLVISSEGSVNNGKDPAIFHITTEGAFTSSYELPEYFKTDGEQQPRHNGVFEGLAESYDGNGYWAGTELPLLKDGPKPKLYPTYSPVRITYFDRNSGKATRQFAMDLAGVSKLPLMYFAINGLTELLEYAPDRFLVLERAYSTGYGTGGNTVRIFDVDARNATNTLYNANLKKSKHTSASKKLVLNFKSIRKQLKEQIVDNIEGMCFGPDLPNGNKTLLLISDDNFSSLLGRQITQIILMEIEQINP